MQSMSLLASMQVAFSFFFGSYFSQRALTYKIVLIPSVKKKPLLREQSFKKRRKISFSLLIIPDPESLKNYKFTFANLLCTLIIIKSKIKQIFLFLFGELKPNFLFSLKPLLGKFTKM